MAENSNIEWTDATWNPLAGCTRVSPGCDNCYAAKMALRLEAMAHKAIEDGKDPGGLRKYIGVATKNKKGVAVFNGLVNLDENELKRPFSWKKPRRVFVNSMSDLFHKDVPFKFVGGVFRVMYLNPEHTFQVLTKRTDRAYEFSLLWGEPSPNVMLGTSVENKDQLWRIDKLRETRAAVRFLSIEPLLGSLGEIDLTGIHWVIVGGESGTNARPMHPQWARDIRDQCQAAGVPFFFKQWGEWAPYDEAEHMKWACCTNAGNAADRWAWLREDGKEGPEWKKDLTTTMVKVGKKAAGRLLDGRTWDEFPQVKEVMPPIE